MEKLVEVSIDLDNPNEKVIMDFFDIERETDHYYICKVDEWNRKHRNFDVSDIKKVSYHNKISCYYRFVTDIEDIREIEKSGEMATAVAKIHERMDYILSYWQRTLANRVARYNRDCGEGAL